jgi:hypothetical protein
MPLTIPWLRIVRQDSSKLCTDNPEVGCVLLVGFHDVVSILGVGRNWTDLLYGIESDNNEFQYWMLRPFRLAEYRATYRNAIDMCCYDKTWSSQWGSGDPWNFFLPRKPDNAAPRDSLFTWQHLIQEGGKTGRYGL